MVTVKVYYAPYCPKCDELIELLSKYSIEIGFDFEPVLVDTSLEVFYTKDQASKIYNKEWMEKFGTDEQRNLYEKAELIFELLGGKTVVPVIEITWFHGVAERTIVVKGFSKEHSRKALSNLIKAIIQLIRLERRVSSIGVKVVR